MFGHVARENGPKESAYGPALAANGPGVSAMGSEYARVPMFNFINGRYQDQELHTADR